MKNNKILLVEDNENDEELTLIALRKSPVKIEVDVVRDGVEALDYLFCEGIYKNRGPELPQVVLLDIKLPKIDGLEVLKRIRNNAKTNLLPVVLLTSSREEKDLMEGYKNRANSYIVKPVDTQQFSTSIQELGLYWLLLNQKISSS
jgi:two-component system, response regulator